MYQINHLNFFAKNWVQINDESRGRYNADSKINLKTTMLQSSLNDYSDAYIHVKGNIKVNNAAAAPAAVSSTNKKVIFKNCAPFTDCINEIMIRKQIMLKILIQ